MNNLLCWGWRGFVLYCPEDPAKEILLYCVFLFFFSDLGIAVAACMVSEVNLLEAPEPSTVHPWGARD
jgi:hypothetical protein